MVNESIGSLIHRDGEDLQCNMLIPSMGDCSI